MSTRYTFNNAQQINTTEKGDIYAGSPPPSLSSKELKKFEKEFDKLKKALAEIVSDEEIKTLVEGLKAKDSKVRKENADSWLDRVRKFLSATSAEVAAKVIAEFLSRIII